MLPPFFKRLRRQGVPTLAAWSASALVFMAAAAAMGHEGHGHGAAQVAIPETAAGVVAEIQKHHGAITAAVTGKNLKAVHDLAETMTALAKALPDKVPVEKKERVQGSTTTMTKMLDTLHHAADAGNQPRAGIELKKLDAVVAALEKQVN